ncbi:MAG TPA: radical SAM protein [Pilimelia sp.]|nr:radical SAM protein [Pilimelia sp.]
MTLTRSRYLLLGRRPYRDPAGRRVRMAYSARRATLFALDESTADALGRGAFDVMDAAQLARLRSLAAVVDAGEDELADVLRRYREGSADPGVRGFTIMPTAYCNMACDYCGQEHVKGGIHRDRVERLASRVEATVADPATRHVGVTWFGGEPLLAMRVIRELSARFVAAADAAGVGYTARMATNGSLLTARTLQILHDECRLGAMDVTIDGPAEVHDRRRVKRNGIGSFHRTVAVLAEAVRSGAVPRLRIGIRVNVDAENEDVVEELLTDLACLGFGSPQVELHLMPVHSWGNDVSAVELAARRMAEREVAWLRLARSLGLGAPDLPTALKRTTCRATSVQGEVVDPAGRVYSCSEHPLVPGVRDTGVVATLAELPGAAPRPRGPFDDWYEQVGDGVQQCGRCPLLPVCGGSCPKLWREGHLPCPTLKFNWEDRIDLAARRLGYAPVDAG